MWVCIIQWYKLFLLYRLIVQYKMAARCYSHTLPVHVSQHAKLVIQLYNFYARSILMTSVLG